MGGIVVARPKPVTLPFWFGGVMIAVILGWAALILMAALPKAGTRCACVRSTGHCSCGVR